MATELAVRPNSGPVLSIEQAIARADLLRGYVKAVMVKGRDYGVIPGTEAKPNKDGTPTRENNTLLQPGAERLCTLFGLVDEYEDAGSIVDHEHGFFHFSFKCILLRNCTREVIEGRTVILGDVAGVAIGSCNSREKKYRRGGKPCPECSAIAIKRSNKPPRNDPNGKNGWYCWAKIGGCGMEFSADDPAILEQKQVDNAAESFDLINTLQKMAQKRAKIGAVRAATNASDFFNNEDGDDPPKTKETGHQEETDDGEIIDWAQRASEATTVSEINSIIQQRGVIPHAEWEAVSATLTAKAKKLGLAWNKTAKCWDAPEPAKEPPKETPKDAPAKSSVFTAVTSSQIDEIEALLPSSGLSMKEALAGAKDTTGSQMVSVMQLSKEQADTVLGRINAGIVEQRRRPA